MHEIGPSSRMLWAKNFASNVCLVLGVNAPHEVLFDNNKDEQTPLFEGMWLPREILYILKEVVVASITICKKVDGKRGERFQLS